MKIVKVEVFQVKTTRPQWRPVFCRIHTDENIYGDGEAALAYGCASEAGYSAVREFASKIIGMNPMQTELIWETLFRTTFWAQNGGPVIFAAIGALDMALWDIKGKALGLPVYELLGGNVRGGMRAYASQLQNLWQYGEKDYVPLSAPKEFARSAENAVKEGYDAVKFDFFECCPDGRGGYRPEERKGFVTNECLSVLEDRLRAVREAVGSKVDIIIESHSRMEAPGAVRYAEIMEKYGVLFYEEPNTPAPHLTETVAKAVHVPLASGERIYGRWQFIPYFEARSLQLIQPDIGNCGGFTEVKKICDMAAAYDIGVQLHICASQLSTSAALHLESVIPNFVIHEHHVANLMQFNQKLTTAELHPKNGVFALPDGPGLGNEISRFAFENAALYSLVE